MKDRSNKFVLKNITQHDYNYISTMLDYSNKNNNLELGYPQCEDLNELIAEIESYENTIDDCLYIVYHKDVPIALVGYLYTPGKKDGYLYGPIIIEEYCSKKNCKKIINLMMNSKKNVFYGLEALVSRNNELLDESFLELGWSYEGSQIGMCFDTDNVKKTLVKHNIVEIDKNNFKDMESVFKLLDNAFNWNGDHNRMDEVLQDICKWGCVFDKNNAVIGVVAWDYMDKVDFSGLEYVVVNKEYRRNGIGESMIRYVINDSIDNNMKHIFLSTDIDNKAANLYKRIGFYNKVIFNMYEKRFTNV